MSPAGLARHRRQLLTRVGLVLDGAGPPASGRALPICPSPTPSSVCTPVGWMAGGGVREGVTPQPPFPGLGADLEVPLLCSVWQPREALPGRCYLKRGENPREPPPARADYSAGLRCAGQPWDAGPRGLGHAGPLFMLKKRFLPEEEAWEKRSWTENAPFIPSLVMLGGSWILGTLGGPRPPPGPPATLSQLGPWSSVSEERARTCRFHSFRRPCRPESCCSRPASVPSCLPGSWVPVGLRGAVPW